MVLDELLEMVPYNDLVKGDEGVSFVAIGEPLVVEGDREDLPPDPAFYE